MGQLGGWLMRGWPLCKSSWSVELQQPHRGAIVHYCSHGARCFYLRPPRFLALSWAALSSAGATCEAAVLLLLPVLPLPLLLLLPVLPLLPLLPPLLLLLALAGCCPPAAACEPLPCHRRAPPLVPSVLLLPLLLLLLP